MSRRHRVCHPLAGAAMFLACSGQPQAPTPVSELPAQTRPASQPPIVSAPSPLVGSYTATISLPACNRLPEKERIRNYAANIDHLGGGRHVVTLGNALFLSGPICTAGSGRFAGLGCHQFMASEDIDTVSFLLENNNDEAHGGHIVEQLSSGGWVEIVGGAGGRFTVSSSSIASIDASGAASVWYCPTAGGYPFPCSAAVSCPSTDLRMTFTRD